MTTILPATKARGQFFKILENIDKPNKTYMITLDGKPKAAIISFDEYESWLETLDILRDTQLIEEIKRSKEEFEKKEYVTLTEILEKEGFIRSKKISNKHEVSGRFKKKSRKKSKKN